MPDELAAAARSAGLNVSSLTQDAVRRALAGRRTSEWLRSLGDLPVIEVGHDEVLDAVHAARDAARGSAAVCVSHQLPIWTLRLNAEGRSYLHDPRKRQCGLASVTSFTFEGDRLARVDYAEPAGPAGKGTVGGA